MPFYDLTCPEGHEQRDLLLKLGERPPCPTCGGPTSTLWQKSASVVGDDIPGGVEVRHGICHEDGSPRRFYSKSEMAKEAKRRGVVNTVRHIGEQGSDKSSKTSRWV